LGILFLTGDRIQILTQRLSATKPDWRTTQIVRREKSEASMPSAAVDADGEIYVLNSRIDTLFKQGAPKVSDFILQQF
jgi:hypothetical protein